MRLFYIENQTGERISLNSATNGILLTNPEGLGINHSNSYADIERGFFTQAKEGVEQGSIAGTLVFLKNAYAGYREFVNWLYAQKELYFIYCPYGSKEFRRRIEIGFLSKSELGNGVYMEVGASFRCLSPWYLPTQTKVEFNNPSASASSVLPFPLDGSVTWAATTASNYSAEIVPSGHMPASVRIEFNGIASDPQITLTGKESGTVYGICKLDGYTVNGKLVLDTSYLNASVKSVQNGVATDLLNYLDITENPFFRIPMEETCILALTSSGLLSGDASVFVNYLYRTV